MNTLASIAARFGVSENQADRAMLRARIVPTSRIGPTRVYADNLLPDIQRALERHVRGFEERTAETRVMNHTGAR